jgi:hypothetical protein
MKRILIISTTHALKILILSLLHLIPENLDDANVASASVFFTYS